MKIKNLMVTGGCGFIGSNFIRYLLEVGEFCGRIVNVDKLTYAGNRKICGNGGWIGERYCFEKAEYLRCRPNENDI
jgi:dTDP-glucose 4,6-dehydratase